jgi:hypothetical protein
MIENLIIITSVINIPNSPFSYTNVRSTYNREERFQQTKNTIISLKNKIPNSKILLVECSELNEEIEYINKNVDYFINLYGNSILENYIFGLSKSLGENTLILGAIDYLIDNNIQYKNLYKISGRYWLTDNFNYNNYDNDKIIYVQKDDIYSSFYKLNVKHVKSYVDFIIKNKELLLKCICAEKFLTLFINYHIDECEKMKIDFAGVAGYIAVYNNYFMEY